MASLTIKNLPEDVHQRLKARATRNRRSLNSEILAVLEALVAREPVDADAFIARIRRLRPEPSRRFTQDDFNAFKAEGRP